MFYKECPQARTESLLLTRTWVYWLGFSLYPSFILED